jgi:glutamate racemase
MSDPRPIGVFDSGIGGLTVVKELQRLMPSERILYLGDTARTPYGNRSEATIRTFGVQAARFLMNMDIKMLIVACNTVSAVALEAIRELTRDIPVIGVVLPGSKAAVLRTAEKKIGVIGTTATIQANAYAKNIQALDPSVKVYGKPCPLFVPIVEEGMLETEIARLTAQYYLYELVDFGIDCLILGCSHYPLLMEVIQGTVGTNIQLIDSAFWTAKEAQDILHALDALNETRRDGLAESLFYLTDLTPNFQENGRKFMGHEIKNLEKIDLEQLTK